MSLGSHFDAHVVPTLLCPSKGTFHQFCMLDFTAGGRNVLRQQSWKLRSASDHKVIPCKTVKFSVARELSATYATNMIIGREVGRYDTYTEAKLF